MPRIRRQALPRDLWLHLLTATEESVVQNTLALAAGKLKEPAYATWLKTNSRKVRSP